ncbi:MAG: hypothetical protein ACTSXZ_04045 [Alphaproteobacteria bacterium]
MNKKSDQADDFRPVHPAAVAGLGFGLGIIMCLPFALATAQANAILQPGFGLQALPYAGLALLLVAFIFAYLRRPVHRFSVHYLRIACALWTGAAIAIWSQGEAGEITKFIGSTSLLLLLIVPWWFAALAGPANFGRRRLLFGMLFWGGFVLVYRLFPSFNETQDTDVVMTGLTQTAAALKLYGVLVLFWLLQVGAVLLWRRIRALNR